MPYRALKGIYTRRRAAALVACVRPGAGSCRTLSSCRPYRTSHLQRGQERTWASAGLQRHIRLTVIYKHWEGVRCVCFYAVVPILPRSHFCAGQRSVVEPRNPSARPIQQCLLMQRHVICLTPVMSGLPHVPIRATRRDPQTAEAVERRRNFDDAYAPSSAPSSAPCSLHIPCHPCTPLPSMTRPASSQILGGTKAANALQRRCRWTLRLQLTKPLSHA